uniref:Putative site-specific DNA endonuclease n=1 Tax=Schizomeris leibleinii TaxID=104533 RepID=F8SYA8_9CHLO|nr:putative site-specific DNA endonuclease [Schizomeris leibleinii]AEH05416.1 putative site-specific DNA endonuclease [Schizomeris leibleinii]
MTTENGNLSRNIRGKALEKYKKSLELTDLQKDVLIGCLLGDASMSLRKGKPHYSIKFEQKADRAEYIYHIYDIFLPFVGSPPLLKFSNKEKTRKAIWFRTYQHDSLIFYYNLFYKQEKSSENPKLFDSIVKVVPKNIHKFLTPRAVAYWFMDDGTYHTDIKSGVKTFLFSTQNFTKPDISLLCNALLTSFGIKTSIHKDKDFWRIYVLSESTEELVSLIKPYLHKDFIYKLELFI